MENNGNNNAGEIREIRFENESLHFKYYQGDTIDEVITLKLGYEYITKTYFTHYTPTEADVEHSINYIEDQLMTDKRLINNDEALQCPNQIFADIMKEVDKTELSRHDVEQVFNKYADCVTGEPPAILEIDYTAEKLAIILIIREIIYHLNFNAIKMS